MHVSSRHASGDLRALQARARNGFLLQIVAGGRDVRDEAGVFVSCGEQVFVMVVDWRNMEQYLDMPRA